MAKHTDAIDPILAPLTDEIARILDLEGVRAFDGHFVTKVVAPGSISGAILAAHDQATVATFDLTITAS